MDSATTQPTTISRSNDTVLDVASAVRRLTEAAIEYEGYYRNECVRLIDKASQSTEANDVRIMLRWQWKRDYANKATVQLRGAYDKGASDVVKMVLAAEPTPDEIERMLEFLPRRFAEGCRVTNGGRWVEDPYRTRYPDSVVTTYHTKKKAGETVSLTIAALHDAKYLWEYCTNQDVSDIARALKDRLFDVVYSRETGRVMNRGTHVATVLGSHVQYESAAWRIVAELVRKMPPPNTYIHAATPTRAIIGITAP